MKNPTLIIYDNAGRIWLVQRGITEVPKGIQGVIVDAPQSFSDVRVDVKTKTVTFVEVPNLEDEVTNLQGAVVELDNRLAKIEEKLNG